MTNWRYWAGLVVVALSIALTKAWLSPGREEPPPGPGPSVSFDALYPAETEAALRAKAQQPNR